MTHRLARSPPRLEPLPCPVIESYFTNWQPVSDSVQKLTSEVAGERGFKCLAYAGGPSERVYCEFESFLEVVDVLQLLRMFSSSMSRGGSDRAPRKRQYAMTATNGANAPLFGKA